MVAGFGARNSSSGDGALSVRVRPISQSRRSETQPARRPMVSCGLVVSGKGGWQRFILDWIQHATINRRLRKGFLMVCIEIKACDLDRSEISLS